MLGQGAAELEVLLVMDFVPTWLKASKDVHNHTDTEETHVEKAV